MNYQLDQTLRMVVNSLSHSIHGPEEDRSFSYRSSGYVSTSLNATDLEFRKRQYVYAVSM